MHFQLIEKEKQSVYSLWCGIWMAALMGTLLSLMDSVTYYWTVLPGIALVIAVGILPRKQRCLAGLAIFVICLVWFYLRYKPILNGLGFFANRLFALSEESQGYSYIYFTVVGEAPAESLFFVSCVIGVLCLWLGGIMNLVLTLAIAVMIAYFGVVPGIVWLCALLVAAFANALPKKDRWLPAILIAAFVTATAFSIKIVAPEPNLEIAMLIENFWEFLVPDVSPPPDMEPPPTLPTMEDETMPTEAPEEEESETEATELPDDFELPDDYGVQGKPEPPTNPVKNEIKPSVNEDIVVKGGTRGYIVKRSLVIPILSVMAVLAGWFWHIERKRKRNRIAMFYETNNASAIRSMFLYAKRWQKLHVAPGEIPQDVEAIWLEAAYSEHEMSDEQRMAMRGFVRESAQTAWRKLRWWERLLVYWYHAL